MTIIKVNALTVPAENGEEVARRFAARISSVDGQDGFEGFELLRPTDERTTWLVVSRWRDEAALEAWMQSPAFCANHKGPDAGAAPHGGQPAEAERPMVVSAELWSFDIATSSGPKKD